MNALMTLGVSLLANLSGLRLLRRRRSAPQVELLYFDGCPSHEAFVPRLHELLAQAGVRAPVRHRRVESEAAAQRQRFLGSPSLRVDGIDVDPGAGDRTDFGLECRLYPTDDGLRGSPPDEWVVNSLRRAGGFAPARTAAASRRPTAQAPGS